MKNFLTISGYDVYFIDTKNKFSAHSKISLLKNILRSIKTHSDFRQCISRYNYFDKFIKNNFSIIDPNDVESLEIKKLVIGSDTVWDIDSRYFIESEDLFWGTKWDKISIISYAASIANSSIKKLRLLAVTLIFIAWGERCTDAVCNTKQKRRCIYWIYSNRSSSEFNY